MSDWVSVDQVAKDDAGNYMALTGGKWVPATGGAKSDDGKYMAIGLQGGASELPSRPAYSTPQVGAAEPNSIIQLPANQQHPPQDASYSPTVTSPLLRQGAAMRARVGNENPGVMDPRYPAWKKAQEQADQLGMVADVAGAALPLVGPALRGVSVLTRPMASRFGALSDTLMGRPAGAAAEGLKGELTGELGGVQGQYASEAAQKQLELDALKRQSVGADAGLNDIAAAQGTVRGKLQQQATTASQQAQQHLDALAPAPMAAEDVGAFIQQRGSANLGKAQEATIKTAIRDIKDPAFENARARAEAGDTPSTNPRSKPLIDAAIQDVEQQISDTPAEFSQGLKKRISALMGGERNMTAAEQRVENLRASVEGRQPATTVNEPITLHQLEFLRRWAKDPSLREQTGFGALDSARMAKTSDTIRAAMQAYEPAVGKYIEAYRAGKEGETAILGGARGTRATDKVLETDAATIFGQKPQLAASAYLDGTQASAGRLLQLVGGNKAEVAPMVRAYLRGQVEGKSPSDVLRVIAKNDGLLKVFPEVRPILVNIAKAGNESERLSSLATKEAGRLRNTSADVVKAREASRATQESAVNEAGAQVAKSTAKAGDYANEITILDTMPADKVAGQARATAKKMLDERFIDAARYRDLSARIAEIERLQGNTQRARNALRYTLYAAGVGATAYGAGRHYLPIP